MQINSNVAEYIIEMVILSLSLEYQKQTNNNCSAKMLSTLHFLLSNIFLLIDNAKNRK